MTLTPEDGAAPEAITVGIIAGRVIPELIWLAEWLAVSCSPRPTEIIVAVEDSGCTGVIERRDDNGVRWLSIPKGGGLGYNRNCVVNASARSPVLVFVDDDCVPAEDWLAQLVSGLVDPSVTAVVGRVDIPPAGFIGDSISALGFPAGGSAGYETMFEVGPDGTTDNLATGNSAIRTSVFSEIGGFDEAMTWGGEDTEFALRLREAGKRIVYRPEAVIVHPARTSLTGFARWFFRRGRAKRQFAKRVSSGVGSYVGKRLASYGTILRSRARDPKIVAIAPLLLASIVAQYAGFLTEWIDPTGAPPFGHEDRRPRQDGPDSGDPDSRSGPTPRR